MLSGLVSGSEQIVLWKLTGARAKANDPISRRAMVVSQKEGVTKVKVMQKERTKGKMEKESQRRVKTKEKASQRIDPRAKATVSHAWALWAFCPRPETVGRTSR